MGLGRIGSDAEAAIPELISLLSDKSERVRSEASLALGKIGPQAIGPLVDASTQQNATVRAKAVEALGTSSAPDERVRMAVLERVIAAGDAWRATA